MCTCADEEQPSALKPCLPNSGTGQGGFLAMVLPAPEAGQRGNFKNSFCVFTSDTLKPLWPRVGGLHHREGRSITLGPLKLNLCELPRPSY